MLPILQLGPFAIQTYPLTLMLAGWAAFAIGARAARRLDLDGNHVYNVGLYGFIAGIVVARFAHVIAYWPAYRSQPIEIFGLNTTAFLAWPGMIAGLAVAGWYIWRHNRAGRRLPLASMLDAIAPGLLVGLAVAGAGALLAGLNPGVPADLPWSVTLWGIRRHPVQVYEAIGFLAVAVFVLGMIRSGARRGGAAFVALLGWGLVVWFVEAFRSPDVTRTLLGGLRLYQVLGLAAALAAMIGLRYLRTRADDHTSRDGPLNPEHFHG